MQRKNYVRVPLGNSMAITVIYDMIEKYPVTEYFPAAKKEEVRAYEELYPDMIHNQNLDPFSFCCFVVNENKKTILIDTGLRERNVKDEGGLLKIMEEAGIKPEDIDIVTYTHLHPDHVAWNTMENEDGTYRKTFPNARYIAQKKDYEESVQGILAAAYPDGCVDARLRSLYEMGELELIDEEEWKLTDTITGYRAPGHTPASSFFILTGGKETAVLAGDIFASPIEVADPDQPYVFDADKKQAIASRKRILREHLSEGTLLGGGHFGIGRITMDGGACLWKEIVSY